MVFKTILDLFTLRVYAIYNRKTSIPLVLAPVILARLTLQMVWILQVALLT